MEEGGGTNLKPGQKFPTPTPGFGDRVFYETLLRQRPNSAMAQEWYEIGHQTLSVHLTLLCYCVTGAFTTECCRTLRRNGCPIF